MKPFFPSPLLSSIATYLAVSTFLAGSTLYAALPGDGESNGNFTIDPDGTEPGDLLVMGLGEIRGSLQVDGLLDVFSGSMKFGGFPHATLPNYFYPGVTMDYVDGSPSSFTLKAHRWDHLWTWKQESNVGTYKQMTLDASNTLRLFTGIVGAEVAGVTISPTSGITLAGPGVGVTLGDGKQLLNATSLRQNSLYDSSGNAMAYLNGSGQLTFTKPALFNNAVNFSGGGSLNSGNVTFLEKMLTNFGYSTRVPMVDFSKSYSSAGSANISVTSTVMDTAGNTYFCGTFSNTAIVENSTLMSAGGTDWFVVKLNDSGIVQWVKKFGGIGGDAARGLAVSPSGSTVYVTGVFDGAPTYGTVVLTSLGSSDIYVAKLNGADGVLLWAKSFGSAGSEAVTSIGVSSDNKPAITGTFSGTLQFGALPPVTSAGSTDVYVSGLAVDGSPEWLTRFGGTASDNVAELKVDASNNIIVGGSFSGVASLGISQALTLTSTGGSDIYLLKFSSVGSPIWRRAYGGANSDNLAGIATGVGDVIYLAGSFSVSTDLDSQTLTSLGSNDGFLCKLLPNGNLEWAGNIGFTSWDSPSRVTCSSTGMLHVTGSFGGPATDAGTSYPTGGSYVKMYTSTQYYVSMFVTSSTYSVSSIHANGTKVVLSGSAGSATRLGDEVIAPGGFIYQWSSGTLLTSPPVPDARLAFGAGIAESQGAVAMGSLAAARGLNSFATGAATAAGASSTAFGQGSQATGANSTALGTSTLASGYNAFAVGGGTRAAGYESTALGSYTSASGYVSTSLGYGTKASGQYSLSTGNFTNAIGVSSSTFGDYTTAQSYLETVFGRYNELQTNPVPSTFSWMPSDNLFVIGNGTSGAPANAVTVKKSGNVGIGIPNPLRKLEVNGDIVLPNWNGDKAIYTWAATDPYWRIGMSATPPFARAITSAHVQYTSYGGAPTQGFAVGVTGGDSAFEIRALDHQAYLRGSLIVGPPQIPADYMGVGGPGAVQFTSAIANDYAYIKNTSLGADSVSLDFVTGDNDENFRFITGDRVVMQIAGQSVGIGTPIPAAKLHVAGSARFDGRVRIAPRGDLDMGEFTSEPAQ